MVSEKLDIRERRRIYEDTISIIAQNQKIYTSITAKERVMKNAIEKQIDRCVSILITVLKQRETVLETEGGGKVTMLTPDDGDNGLIIEKERFKEIVQRLPNNKELKETLWKTCVKRDEIVATKLNALIA